MHVKQIALNGVSWSALYWAQSDRPAQHQRVVFMAGRALGLFRVSASVRSSPFK